MGVTHIASSHEQFRSRIDTQTMPYDYRMDITGILF